MYVHPEPGLMFDQDGQDSLPRPGQPDCERRSGRPHSGVRRRGVLML